MKIKYFAGEVNVKNSEELGDYLIDELGYANDPTVQAYADLLFKIHEKIEYHRNLRRDTQMRDIDSDPVIKELKSLLNGDAGQ